MEYKVTMPILSDTMDKGKLTKWYVNIGDNVKKGDSLAEIESDKATMDIESFYDGVIKEILVNEGDEVEVKSVIAIIDTNAKIKQPKKQKTQIKHQIKIKPEIKEVVSFIKSDLSGSPLAKKLAKKYNIELPKNAHEKDVLELVKNRYFTSKAKKLLEEYKIDFEKFELNKKYTSSDILEYIKNNNLSKVIPLTPNQQAVIKNLKSSVLKPTFFVFESLEIKNIENLTPSIIKAFGLAMQKNPLTRAILKENKLLIYPNSNISIAIQREDGLFMCVIKEVENKTIEDIKEWLKEIKVKKLSIDDVTGSTFGISNLGMYNVESFTALINEQDSGICAIGSVMEDKIKINFTIDHRILNGINVAKFVNDIKKEIKCMM